MKKLYASVAVHAICAVHMSADSPFATPVVVIETKNGPVRLNESEYDPNIHKLAKDQSAAWPDGGPVATPVEGAEVVHAEPIAPGAEPALTPPAEPTPPAPAAELPVAPGVVQDGAKWFVVDMNRDNAKIGEVEGYPSQAKATKAAEALVPAPAA